MQLWASLRRTYFVHMSCSNVFQSKLFFFFFLSSKVRTRFEPEPNLLNPVLLVLVCGSPFCLPQVQFWFKVLRDTSENRTEPNFGIPKQLKTSRLMTLKSQLRTCNIQHHQQHHGTGGHQRE